MKLLAFGCSNTYGEGLLDCRRDLGTRDPPSKLAWPQLVADHFGWELANLSEPGSSAKQALHTQLNTPQDPNTVVINCWSYPQRHTIITKPYREWKFLHLSGTKQGYITIHPSNVKRGCKASTAYYKRIQNDYDSSQEFYSYVQLAELYSSCKGAITLHATCNNVKHRPNWFDVELHTTTIQHVLEAYELAEDGVHPGAQAHQAFASTVVDSLQQKLKL